MQVEIRKNLADHHCSQISSAFLYLQPHLSICLKRLVCHTHCQSKCFVLFLLLILEQAFHSVGDRISGVWLPSTMLIFPWKCRSLNLARTFLVFPSYIHIQNSIKSLRTRSTLYCAEITAHWASSNKVDKQRFCITSITWSSEDNFMLWPAEGPDVLLTCLGLNRWDSEVLHYCLPSRNAELE